LPTKSHLHSTLPHLYTNNLCPRCNIAPESTHHVWLCKESDTTITQIINNTIIQANLTFKNNKNFNPKSFQQLINSPLNCINLVFGLLNINAYFKNLKLFTKDLKILSDLQNDLLELIYYEIWIPRNKSMIEEEKIYNITQSDKLRKNKTPPPNKKSKEKITSTTKPPNLNTNNLAKIIIKTFSENLSMPFPDRINY